MIDSTNDVGNIGVKVTYAGHTWRNLTPPLSISTNVIVVARSYFTFKIVELFSLIKYFIAYIFSIRRIVILVSNNIFSHNVVHHHFFKLYKYIILLRLKINWYTARFEPRRPQYGQTNNYLIARKLSVGLHRICYDKNELYMNSWRIIIPQ